MTLANCDDRSLRDQVGLRQEGRVASGMTNVGTEARHTTDRFAIEMDCRDRCSRIGKAYRQARTERLDMFPCFILTRRRSFPIAKQSFPTNVLLDDAVVYLH
jgi:hypothetical protein